MVKDSMNEYIFFLGSNATLSTAEIFATLKRDGFEVDVDWADERVLLVNLDGELPANFLRGVGGVERIAEVIGKKDKMWSAEEVVDQLSPLPDKWRLGVSGVHIETRQLRGLGQKIKKAAGIAEGSKVRFVMPKGRNNQLNAAQVLFNRLYEKPHRELIFVNGGGRFWLAETVDVQRIDEYEVRDTQRPVRDGKIGMLPPKLAQIMLNLVPDLSSKAPVICDPFCGMGTVLQEGWLKNYRMVGSDIRDTMVAASEQNLEWLTRHFNVNKALEPDVFTHDIQAPYREERWNLAEAIVTEPFLGKPLSAPLSPTLADKLWEDIWPLYDALFRRGKEILLPNGYLVTVLPAVRVDYRGKMKWEFFPGSFVDSLSKKGYSWVQLVPEVSQYEYKGTERGSVFYARPDALVGREITLWQNNI